MKSWIHKAVTYYALLQIPEFFLLALILYGLRQWYGIQVWILIVIAAVWIVKDVILFFYVRGAYEMKKHSHDPRTLGATGITIEVLDLLGYVEVNGELWQAKSEDKSIIPAGEKIEVVDHQGLQLVVRPIRKT
jgi:membrane protein implicated in regulation of membrane protease activity